MYVCMYVQHHREYMKAVISLKMFSDLNFVDSTTKCATKSIKINNYLISLGEGLLFCVYTNR